MDFLYPTCWGFHRLLLVESLNRLDVYSNLSLLKFDIPKIQETKIFGSSLGSEVVLIPLLFLIELGSNDAIKLVKTLHDSSLNFKYATLEKATGSFDNANKLGQGGFGTVYKVVYY